MRGIAPTLAALHAPHHMVEMFYWNRLLLAPGWLVRARPPCTPHHFKIITKNLTRLVAKMPIWTLSVVAAGSVNNASRATHQTFFNSLSTLCSKMMSAVQAKCVCSLLSAKDPVQHVCMMCLSDRRGCCTTTSSLMVHQHLLTKAIRNRQFLPRLRFSIRQSCKTLDRVGVPSAL